MKSAAAIVLGLAATACSHDFDVMEKVEQQSIDNAQQTLGFYIPEDQDWKMTSNATANFSVAGASDETYTVKIYSNNLFEDGIGYIITKKNVQGGQNFTAEFAYPAFQKSLYVGLTDSKGRTTYKIADIVDGKLTSLNDVSSARTRASKAGEYANGNMWAAEGYSVPDPLTEGQKLRVQYYFQRVKNPGGTPDYGQRDFFMQQVYDGGTDPITKYDGYTSPAYSLEKYPAVSGQLIESGEHMDHLTAGPDHTHINNFNNGNCGVYGNVLDNGGDINNGPWHEDQIMLMKNTKTSCFGYANSDDSYRHDDRWTLVSGEVIDAYCDDPANGYADFLKAHPGVVDKKCYWDDWKRSYIGFDFDMLPDDKTYAWNWENGQKTTPKTVVYSGWASPQGGDNLIFTESGQVSTITDWNAEIKVKGNNVIRVLDSNTNMYCGEVKGIGGMDGHSEWTEVADYDPNGTNDNSLYIKGLPGYDSNHTALNMKFLAKKYEEGWLPVDTKQLKLWVKVGGCNDGYYSDWIVSFLPGDPNTNIIIEEENQTYTYAFEDNKTTCDFDLNDVVIWVKVNENDENKIDITLVAAGCEFDNYVFLGTTRIEWLKGAEVHDALGIAKGVMFNTKSNTVDPSTFVTTTIDKPQGFNIEQADFKIMPYAKGSDFSDPTARKEKDGDGYIRTSALVTMESETATAPIGLVFPCKWHWPKERVIVSNAYNNFNKWGSLPNATVRATVSDWYKYPKSGQVVTWETTNE